MGILEGASGARAGRELAGNPGRTAPDDVHDPLTAGGADSRALVILGGLTGRGPVVVTGLPVVPGEEPARTRHRVAVAGLAPDDVFWLRSQQPPYAPTIDLTAGEVALTWTLPAPAAVLNRWDRPNR